MKKKKPKKTFVDYMLTMILILAIGVFCYAGYQLMNIFLEYKEGKDEYQELTQLAVAFVETEEVEEIKVVEEIVTTEDFDESEESEESESFPKRMIYNLKKIEENADITEEETAEENVETVKKITLSQLAKVILSEISSLKNSSVQTPIEVDFEVLQEINEEIIGWIYVEGLEEINYPIVQGEDNEKYLHTTYEGTYNFAGTLFVDYKNHCDFKDCNTIIYGHNMKNGSMFGKLRKFVSDSEVYEKSKYFWILTPEGNYRYEIVSAYTTAVNSDTYTLFYERDESFREYLAYIRACSELETSLRKLAIWDKVVTLSTCTGNDATRFVVQGIRVNIC